ncbi:hypothetical protein Tco_1290813, partial [Tanacetum coccineum]
APQGEVLGQIKPRFAKSYSWSGSSCISEGASLYGARAAGAAPGIKSIWNSTWRTGGRPCRFSGKNSEDSLTIGISSSRFSSDFFSIT